MAVNDLITVGATPLVVQAYWAAGGSDWFDDAARAQALVAGWKRACDVCGVAWGGGETPALAGIVEAGRIDLAAACTGLVNPKAAALAGRTARRRRCDRAAGLERHPRQRPEPGAQAGRATAAGLPDARSQRGLELRRGAARADRCCIRRSPKRCCGPASRRTSRQHHRPRLAQAAAPPQALHATASRVPDVPPVLRFIQQQARHGRPRGLRHAQHGRRLRAVRAGRPGAAHASRWRARRASKAMVAGAVEAGDKRTADRAAGPALRAASDLQLR